MRTTTPAKLSVLALITLGACGPAALETTTSARSLGIGGQARRVQTLTDVDRVRDLSGNAERVYAATDLGVLSYATMGSPIGKRITKNEGLPGNDATAIATSAAGETIVATNAGLAKIEGERATALGEEPPVGKIVDLAFRRDGSLFACGERGVARRKDGAWALFGEPVRCTVLENGADDTLWIGTTSGLLVLEGDDTIREHGVARGIPEGYVQDVAPMGEGRALALLRGPAQSVLGYWDGMAWYAYTVADFSPEILGLTPQGESAILLVRGHAFAIAPTRGGRHVRLTALGASEPVGVRSYRARITPAAGVVVSTDRLEPAREPAALAPVPERAPSVEAPSLDVRPMNGTWPDDLYAAATVGDSIVVADHNRGLLHRAPGGDRHLRTNDLIAGATLSTATDTMGRTWLVTARGDLVTIDDAGVLKRMALPDNAVALAVSMGEGGAYLLTRVGAAGSTLRIYRADAGRWTQLFERTLTLQNEFAGASFFGVANENEFWIGLTVRAGGQLRPRGVAVLNKNQETITYHHRGATPANDGPGAVSLADEVNAVAFSEGAAWFASLSGAIRVKDGQATAFGEARGVRGEMVTDLAAAPGGKLWVAAAEGIGVYENGAFNFILPAAVQQMRPSSVAVDTAGNLYCAGSHGVVYYDGTTWHTLRASTGELPVEDIKSIDVDTRDRLWLLTDEGLLLFTRDRGQPAVTAATH